MKKNISLLVGVVILFFAFSANAQLSNPTRLKMIDQHQAFRDAAGYEQAETVDSIIANVIEAFLGLLGIIFIVLIVYAGYNWMTAGGNEEKVSKAKSTLSKAIIGLVIIVSAYAITYFVFKNL